MPSASAPTVRHGHSLDNPSPGTERHCCGAVHRGEAYDTFVRLEINRRHSRCAGGET